MLSARDRGVPGTGWQMPETGATSSIPPIHIEETLRSVAGLNAEHHANATHHQRAVDRITSLLGRASTKRGPPPRAVSQPAGPIAQLFGAKPPLTHEGNLKPDQGLTAATADVAVRR